MLSNLRRSSSHSSRKVRIALNSCITGWTIHYSLLKLYTKQPLKTTTTITAILDKPKWWYYYYSYDNLWIKLLLLLGCSSSGSARWGYQRSTSRFIFQKTGRESFTSATALFSISLSDAISWGSQQTPSAVHSLYTSGGKRLISKGKVLSHSECLFSLLW